MDKGNNTLKLLKQELKARLLKFDALHGLYMVPLGIAGLAALYYSERYAYHFLIALVFLYGLVEGIRKIIHNPAKYEAKLHALRQKYAHLFEDDNANPPAK